MNRARPAMHMLSFVIRFALLLSLLSAVGCSRFTSLGVSGAPGDPEQGDAGSPQRSSDSGAPPVVVPSPRRPTAIVAGHGEALSWGTPPLGDVDGDGLADFLLQASDLIDSQGTNNYLFYGRPEFPSELVTSDADAVFEADNLDIAALGDINGDQLADFALGSETGYQIVLGSRTRWMGSRAPFSSGPAWRFKAQDATVDRAGWDLHLLRRGGDVDGDGRAELLVSIWSEIPESELSMRPGPLQTDYLVAGRSDGWPSGTWDPSWAIAQLGDEPPAIEDLGATTVIQRLVVLGHPDLDADGYDDLVALGRWSAWVFYGSPAGFRGTLTPEHAAAELTWSYPIAEPWTFAKTVPFVVGDVDGDGASDLALPQGGELGIVYGSKDRWSGRVQLQPDLALEAAGTTVFATSGDIDGDTLPELLVLFNETPTDPSGTPVPSTSALYAYSVATRGATGRHALSGTDLYRPGRVSPPAAISSTFLMDLAGDVDGDGSSDLLVGALDERVTEESSGVVYLVPGTPRAPD